MNIYQIIEIIVLLTVTLIVASNFLFWKPVNHYSRTRKDRPWPSVSVLVPARNEERVIEACARSLLQQDYPEFEVLILDDHSEDQTPLILEGLLTEYPRLRVLNGQPLPDGWLGKHWACDQLARAATGEMLLFADADTVFHANAVRDILAAGMGLRADMLAVVPSQCMETWAEKLAVPFFLHALFLFVPLPLAYILPLPFLTFAIGQCMLFRKQAYWQAGGHAEIRSDVVDDVALARNIKAAGLRWRVADGRKRVETRMYTDFDGVVEGFSKNAYPSFGYNVIAFLFAWIGLAAIFFVPLIAVLLPLAGVDTDPKNWLFGLLGVSLSVLIWMMYYGHLGYPVGLALIYPVMLIFNTWLALRSLWLTLTGQAVWKDRNVSRRG